MQALQPAHDWDREALKKLGFSTDGSPDRQLDEEHS
jgi:hypothetical protein